MSRWHWALTAITAATMRCAGGSLAAALIDCFYWLLLLLLLLPNQVALGAHGYYCGDDEMRWWQFGSSTLDALKTFQACNGLPESGATDERTWLALLGPDATPAELQVCNVYDQAACTFSALNCTELGMPRGLVGAVGNKKFGLVKNGLPESGASDERTWLALLGPDATPAQLQVNVICCFEHYVCVQPSALGVLFD
jgi:hypothetical protein